MFISIIVPVYNGEKVISRCLESLQLIKEEDIEFLIINDGSTDRTKEICEIYAQNDRRFRLINQSNAGVSKARNTGLNYSKGEYIGFVDADDEITEEYEEILCTVKSVQSDLYAFAQYIKNTKGVKKQERYLYNKGKNESRVLYNNFLAGNSNCVWNNIYKKSIIQQNEICFPENVKMGEDCIFNAQYFTYCKELYYIDKAGYKYYDDSNESASKQRKSGYLEDFIKVYECYAKIYNLDSSLQFTFPCSYYFDIVYEILRDKRKEISLSSKKVLRRSAFYKKIMSYEYDSRKRKIRKWIIRWYLYLEVFF